MLTSKSVIKLESELLQICHRNFILPVHIYKHVHAPFNAHFSGLPGLRGCLVAPLIFFVFRTVRSWILFSTIPPCLLIHGLILSVSVVVQCLIGQNSHLCNTNFSFQIRLNANTNVALLTYKTLKLEVSASCIQWLHLWVTEDQVHHYQKWLLVIVFWSYLLYAYEFARRTRTPVNTHSTKKRLKHLMNFECDENIWTSNVVECECILRHIHTLSQCVPHVSICLYLQNWVNIVTS